MRIIQNPPYGAILTPRFILEMIERAKQGEHIRVFYAYGLGSESYAATYLLLPETVVLVDEYGIYLRNVKEVLENKDKEEYYVDHSGFSLKDCNVSEINGYNDHYLFIDPELLADYLQLIASNTTLRNLMDMEVKRNQYWADLWDRVHGDWYDAEWYDQDDYIDKEPDDGDEIA